MEKQAIFELNAWLIFTTPPLFDAPLEGNPLEFLDETYLAKTRRMGLPYGKNFMFHFKI